MSNNSRESETIGEVAARRRLLMRERLSRIGAGLGNWNDLHSRHDSRWEASLRWRLLDRFSSWLYVMPDSVTQRARQDFDHTFNS